MKSGKHEAVDIDIVCPTAQSVLEYGWCSNSLSFAVSTPKIECAHNLCPTLLLLSLRLKNTKVISVIKKNACFLHLIHLSYGIRDMRQRTSPTCPGPPPCLLSCSAAVG